MKEEWKAWPGAPDMYEVSNKGRVRSLTRTRNGEPLIRSLQPDKDGYLRVSLFGRQDSRRGNYSVHKLVLETFIGECPEGYEADHINRKRDDNREQNLRWVTRQSNIERRKVAKGKNNPTSAQNPNGRRCSAITAKGIRCTARAYVQIEGSWLCGSHKSQREKHVPLSQPNQTTHSQR